MRGRAITATPLPEYFFDIFPKLETSGFLQRSEPDGRYNCVAFSLGIQNRWRWVDRKGKWIKHKSILQEAIDTATFIKPFLAEGFTVCQDGQFESGVIKIAIYAKNGMVEHVAVQRSERSGRWFSKMGDSNDIEHDLTDLEDGDYGNVSVFLCKTKSRRRALR